jgi:hypothetical protein
MVWCTIITAIWHTVPLFQDAERKAHDEHAVVRSYFCSQRAWYLNHMCLSGGSMGSDVICVSSGKMVNAADDRVALVSSISSQVVTRLGMLTLKPGLALHVLHLAQR